MALAENDIPAAVARPQARPLARLSDALHRVVARRTADPGFRRWAARVPLIRRLARRDGERLFDLMAGFAYSQIVHAVVALDLLTPLSRGACTLVDLARHAGIDADRMHRLCRGAEALGLVRRDAAGAYTLDRLGVALATVPGLSGMVAHHAILYRDLADPAAFFRGDSDPELAAFWPYVFGPGAAGDQASADRYSALMADTQALVAEEVLKTVDLSGVRRLMDVGGGTGAFMAAALSAAPHLEGVLVDLPAVVAGVGARFENSDLAARLAVQTADFRSDPLPGGADAVALVRVLYDHEDATVLPLLRKIRAALPPGGRLIVAEPMSAGTPPDRFADAYFSLYCMAMRTGRLRSVDEVRALCAEAGFAWSVERPVHRPFITRIVEARPA